jgi:hypothetical protein
VTTTKTKPARGFPALSEVLAEPSLYAQLRSATGRLLGPETVIALLGLGSLTLGGCMPRVRPEFESSRLTPDAYGGGAERRDAAASEANLSREAPCTPGAEPSTVETSRDGE